MIIFYFVLEIVYERISNWCSNYDWLRQPPMQFQFVTSPESIKNLIPSGKSSKHVILKGSIKFSWFNESDSWPCLSGFDLDLSGIYKTFTWNNTRCSFVEQHEIQIHPIIVGNFEIITVDFVYHVSCNQSQIFVTEIASFLNFCSLVDNLKVSTENRSKILDE